MMDRQTGMYMYIRAHRTEHHTDAIRPQHGVASVCTTWHRLVRDARHLWRHVEVVEEPPIKERVRILF